MPCLTVLVAVALAAPQEPAVTGPRFAWPPVCDRPLRYTVKLTKQRALADELAAAVREARAQLGLDGRRQPRQSVQIEIDIALRADDESVDVTYETRLVGRPRLRWKLVEATTGDKVPAHGNDHLDVWGLPDDRGAALPQVPRNAVERAFARSFRRGPGGGARPADIGDQFGDHLLPLIWDQPLPCWVGQMANVVVLAGEAAIEGKTLIRDGSGSFPLGHRETRVELRFTEVSGTAFTITYELAIRQVVTKTRDLQSKLPQPWEWHLTVGGVATYHVGDKAFERVRETVTGRPEGLGPEQLARLRDQAFTGTIEVARQRDPKADKRRRGRQARHTPGTP